MKVITPAEIKAIRTRLKLSQPEFGKLLRVREETVCRWERGKSVPYILFQEMMRDLKVDAGFKDYLSSVLKKRKSKGGKS